MAPARQQHLPKLVPHAGDPGPLDSHTMRSDMRRAFIAVALMVAVAALAKADALTMRIVPDYSIGFLMTASADYPGLAKPVTFRSGEYGASWSYLFAVKDFDSVKCADDSKAVVVRFDRAAKQVTVDCE